MSEEQNQLETPSQNLGGSPEELANAQEFSDPTDSENGPSGFSSEEPSASLEQQVETLKQQILDDQQQTDALKKRYITLAAEFDNYRKRTFKEKEDLERTVKAKTLSELLPIVDNFERARTQIKPITDAEMTIHKSYQGVYKTLVDSLKRLGVAAMRPEGQLFDPNYHEAMLREYTNDYPEGTIIEQLVRGYLLEETVLRHALVKVAAPKESDAEDKDSFESLS